MSDHTHEHHVTSVSTLIATFVALVALTILTSVMAYVDLGRADIWVVLVIATTKAALVATIFMHLLHDKAFNGVILLGTLVFVSLFVGFTLMDSTQYAPDIEAYDSIVKQEAYKKELEKAAAAAPAATPAGEPNAH